jgi:hypothetical protein
MRRLPVTFPELGIRQEFLARFIADTDDPSKIGDVYIYGGVDREIVLQDIWTFEIQRSMAQLGSISLLSHKEPIQGVDPATVDPLLIGFPKSDEFLQVAVRVEGQIISEVVSLKDGSRAPMELAKQFDMRQNYTIHPEVCGESAGGVTVYDRSSCPTATPECTTVDGFQNCQCPGAGHNIDSPPACTTDADCELAGQSSHQDCDEVAGVCVVAADINGDGTYCPTDLNCQGTPNDVCLVAATPDFQSQAGVSSTTVVGTQSFMAPATIQGTSAEYVEDFRAVLMFGGQRNDGSYTNSLHRFHPYLGYFKEVIPTNSIRPPARSDAAIGWDKETQTLYVAAGWDEQSTFHDIWRIQPFVEFPVWEEVGTVPGLPTERTGGTVLVWGADAFDIVGHDGTLQAVLPNATQTPDGNWHAGAWHNVWSVPEARYAAAHPAAALVVEQRGLVSYDWESGNEIEVIPTVDQSSHGEVLIRGADDLVLWHAGQNILFKAKVNEHGELYDEEQFVLSVTLDEARLEIGPADDIYLVDGENWLTISAPLGKPVPHFVEKHANPLPTASVYDISFSRGHGVLYLILDDTLVLSEVDETGSVTPVNELTVDFAAIRSDGGFLFTEGTGGPQLYRYHSSSLIPRGPHNRSEWVVRAVDRSESVRVELSNGGASAWVWQ